MPNWLRVPHKINFKSKKVIRDKGHYILIESLPKQEDRTIMNIYEPKDRLSKYMKQKPTELKGKTEVLNRWRLQDLTHNNG